MFPELNTGSSIMFPKRKRRSIRWEDRTVSGIESADVESVSRSLSPEELDEALNALPSCDVIDGWRRREGGAREMARRREGAEGLLGMARELEHGVEERADRTMAMGGREGFDAYEIRRS
jgi:hypothetical protein